MSGRAAKRTVCSAASRRGRTMLYYSIVCTYNTRCRYEASSLTYCTICKYIIYIIILYYIYIYIYYIITYYTRYMYIYVYTYYILLHYYSLPFSLDILYYITQHNISGRAAARHPATRKHGWSKHDSSIICQIQTWTIRILWYRVC